MSGRRRPPNVPALPVRPLHRYVRRPSVDRDLMPFRRQVLFRRFCYFAYRSSLLVGAHELGNLGDRPRRHANDVEPYRDECGSSWTVV